jgi:hypothetical protein
MTFTALQGRRLPNRALAFTLFAALIIEGLSGCRQASVNDRAPKSLMVTSASFSPGGNIPEQFSCHGANLSPSLAWGPLPANTKSFALVSVIRTHCSVHTSTGSCTTCRPKRALLLKVSREPRSCPMARSRVSTQGMRSAMQDRAPLENLPIDMFSPSMRLTQC